MLGCKGVGRTSRASAEPVAHADASLEGGVMTDPSFAEAEALLAKSGRRWERVGLTSPSFRWSGQGARTAEYHTRPETFVKVIVHAFATEKDAIAAEPEIVKSVFEGARIRCVRKVAYVFWIESPVVFPNPDLARDTHATFDAVAKGIASGVAP